MSAGAQFTKFCAVGAVATALQYGILVGLVRMFDTDPTLASSIGFAVSAIGNYQLNYYFTFQSDRSHAHTGIRFAMIALSGLALNAGIMHVGATIVGIHYLGAQVLATLVVVGWTFFANRRWSFAPLSSADTKAKSIRSP